MSFQPSPNLQSSSTTGTSTTNVNLGSGSNEVPGKNTSVGENSTAVVASAIDNTNAYRGIVGSLANSPNVNGVTSTQGYLAAKLNILNQGTKPPATGLLPTFPG